MLQISSSEVIVLVIYVLFCKKLPQKKVVENDTHFYIIICVAQ